jgi:hypothetical protein
VRRFGLFVALTVASGVAALSGALVGAALIPSDTAFFGTGLVSGAVAVWVVSRMLVWRCVVERQRYRAVLTGALIGLGCAAVVSALTALFIVPPLLSFGFVGGGAVIADVEAASNERRASTARVA